MTNDSPIDETDQETARQEFEMWCASQFITTYRNHQGDFSIGVGNIWEAWKHQQTIIDDLKKRLAAANLGWA